MAFPWTFEENFSDGTLGNFNSETDVGTILDFPHYAKLANAGLAPWNDAYCMRARLNGVSVAYLQEDAGFDLAANTTLYVWFPVCIAADVALTDGDTVILFAMQSAGPVNEAVFGVRNNAGVYELFAGETGATRTLPIVRSNQTWYQIELAVHLDAGGGNDGTLDFYVDGAQVGAQITGLDQAEITQAWYGPSSGTAAGNRGTILFGPIIADDARVRTRNRLPSHVRWITQDAHAFIGSCIVDSVALTGTGVDAVLALYDTDDYPGVLTARGPLEPRVYIRNTVANEVVPGMSVPTHFHNGVFATLAGTAPQAWISLGKGLISGAVLNTAQYVIRGRARQSR